MRYFHIFIRYCIRGEPREGVEKEKSLCSVINRLCQPNSLIECGPPQNLIFVHDLCYARKLYAVQRDVNIHKHSLMIIFLYNFSNFVVVFFYSQQRTMFRTTHLFYKLVYVYFSVYTGQSWVSTLINININVRPI